MNTEVAAFTVSEKSINTSMQQVISRCHFHKEIGKMTVKNNYGDEFRCLKSFMNSLHAG